MIEVSFCKVKVIDPMLSQACKERPFEICYIACAMLKSSVVVQNVGITTCSVLMIPEGSALHRRILFTSKHWQRLQHLSRLWKPARFFHDREATIIIVDISVSSSAAKLKDRWSIPHEANSVMILGCTGLIVKHLDGMMVDRHFSYILFYF